MIAFLSILLTLFVVLTERKFLAYAQRRMGPAIMGRNGAFQIALDLVKLLTKEIFLIPRPSTALAPIFLALLYSTQLVFSQNFIWGPSIFLFQSVDSLILFHLVLVLFSNIFFVLVGFISQSRYAIIGTVRALVHVISLDIFVTVLYSLLVFSAQSANFHDFANTQNLYWFFFLYSPAASAFIVLLLLESKRTPFDHAETESEVVAGYAVEYSGPMLLMFYLAEYLHLVISSVHFVIFFFGGWWSLKFFFFLPPIFSISHDVSFWNELFNNYNRNLFF
uniref:NADH-ubiquinone oxidoreductase chain 1 n=1 Tax=Laurentiella strenua TaxID=114681 RepID=A0A2I4PET8_9SPIT|nr:nad1_a [Laurentiella strenua]